MLHKIHRGSGLFNAATYTVVGNGGNSSQYGAINFPAMPGGVQQCVRCHGNDAWKEPARAQPRLRDRPGPRWGVVCGSCHDGPTAAAPHRREHGRAGVEACADLPRRRQDRRRGEGPHAEVARARPSGRAQGSVPPAGRQAEAVGRRDRSIPASVRPPSPVPRPPSPSNVGIAPRGGAPAGSAVPRPDPPAPLRSAREHGASPARPCPCVGQSVRAWDPSRFGSSPKVDVLGGQPHDRGDRPHEEVRDADGA